MSATTDPRGRARLGAQEHPFCVACSLHHPSGLHMQFHPTEDGGVAATVDCVPAFQGYTGLMHGGIISLMLDAAMTNCLFQRGVVALTARLSLRFLNQAHTGRSAVVAARVVREAASAYVLEASFRQSGRLIATGEAVFLRKTPMSPGAGESMP